MNPQDTPTGRMITRVQVLEMKTLRDIENAKRMKHFGSLRLYKAFYRSLVRINRYLGGRLYR